MWPPLIRRPTWHPSALGADLVFYGRADADQLTLIGDAVAGIVNDGGTGTSPVAAPGAEAAYDTSVLLNGRGSIRTTFGCNLSGTGGVTGTGAFHVIVLAQTLTPGSSAGEASTFFSMGAGAGSGIAGIGSVINPGAVMWVGGFGQPTIQGTDVPFDTEVRVYEYVNDGATVSLRMDFSWLAEFAGTTTLGSDRFGWFGSYPHANYQPPDARTWEVIIARRLLTDPERVKIGKMIKSRNTLSPRRRIIGIGDSTVRGNIAGAGTTHSDLEDMQTLLAGTANPIDILNAGVTNETTSQIRDRVTPTFLARICPQGGAFGPRDVYIRGGFNNTFFGLDAPSAYADLLATHAAVKAWSPSIRTWIGTSFGGVGVSPLTVAYFDDLNELIVNGAVAGGYGALDYRDLVPVPITTNELPDSIHQSEELFELQALHNIDAMGLG